MSVSSISSNLFMNTNATKEADLQEKKSMLSKKAQQMQANTFYKMLNGENDTIVKTAAPNLSALEEENKGDYETQPYEPKEFIA